MKPPLNKLLLAVIAIGLAGCRLEVAVPEGGASSQPRAGTTAMSCSSVRGK